MTSLPLSLQNILGRFFPLGKSRLETLSVLVVGLVMARTVNLSHLASHFAGAAKLSSNYRRLQRFFQFVALDNKAVARLIVTTLNLDRKKRLALDRTNWKFGATHINILVLAIVTRRFRVPIFWSFLPHQGNSDTAHRIALIGRYIDCFGVDGVELLLADREFIGAEWIDFLCKNKVPFAIRLRADVAIDLQEGGTWLFKTLLRGRRIRTVTRIWRGRFPSSVLPQTLNFAAREIKSSEWLIIVTNMADAKRALREYKKRWGIECLFADAKRRGFNLEDTHLTQAKKLSTLMAVIAVAMSWAYACASTLMGYKVIKRNAHKRRKKSWFRTGLDALRKWIVHEPDKAVAAWTKYHSKSP